MKELPIRFIRGDGKRIVERAFQLPGDHTNRKLRFRVLVDKTETSRVVFSKSSTNYGGAENELTIIYDSEKDITEVIPNAIPDDTVGYQLGRYYYSLTSTDPNNDEDTVTYFRGEFYLMWDGESPFNEFPPTEDYEKVVLLNTTDFPNNTLIMFKHGEGFVPISLESLKDLLGAQSNNELFINDEIDLFNLAGVTPSQDNLQKQVTELKNSNLLELDEEGNLTIKEI